MKIQSRFKDYYDFISHRFGEDPGVVYVREPLPESLIEWGEGRYFNDTLAGPYRDTTFVEHVVAGPHVIPFVGRTGGEANTMVGPVHDYLFTPVYKIRSRWHRNRLPQFPSVPQGERLNNLIRIVGAPVFRVCGPETIYEKGKYLYKLRVDKRIPVLADLGFPAILPPEQLWQELYAVLTNVLRTNPDKMPPPLVTNADKIHAAGFDLKSSFRHPVNVKKVKPPK